MKYIYIPWELEIDHFRNLEKEIAEKKLEIEIGRPVPAYNLFGYKFLWRIVLVFQDPRERKEEEFLKDKIAKKEFYLE